MLAGVDALAEKAWTIIAEARTVQGTAHDYNGLKDALGLCVWAMALAAETSVSKTGTDRLLARMSEALTEGIAEANCRPLSLLRPSSMTSHATLLTKDNLMI